MGGIGKRPFQRAEIARVNRHTAGIDIGSSQHYVAVSPESAAQPVRVFSSFTADLQALADWLTECAVTSVAMESTGVFWIPLYEILEDRGFEVVLVNARHVKNVPGRKTDVQDCQWLQELHSYGLLRGSFRPAQEIATLRALMRHRDTLVRYAANHVQHMQKALTLMNVQLHNILSDITGVTGMAILRDIAGGERDPARLVRHRSERCRASRAVFVASLTGNYRNEHVFALRQAIDLYDVYQQKLQECDAAIEAQLASLSVEACPRAPLPEPAKRVRRQTNQPRFDIRRYLYQITSVDLTQIDGVSGYSALTVVSEIGHDMSRWPTAKHFASWTTLAPQNKITGGKRFGSGTQRSANRVARVLRLCAQSVGRTQTALGAYYRRLAARVGKAKAITATARKLAVTIYSMLKFGSTYVDFGADAYNQRYRSKVLANLRRRAKSLGFELTQISAENDALVS